MTTEIKYKKPLPLALNPSLTKPFWEATKRHELIMPRCKKCDHLFFYPREVCPRCLSSDLEYAPVSGKGRVYSFTIVNQPGNPAFQPDAPYVNAIIQLVEGPRMPSNVIGCDPHDVRIDMLVEAVYEDVTPEVTIVKFKPSEM